MEDQREVFFKFSFCFVCFFEYFFFFLEKCESDSSFLQLTTARYNILSRKDYVHLLSDVLYDYVVPIISRCKTDLSFFVR